MLWVFPGMELRMLSMQIVLHSWHYGGLATTSSVRVMNSSFLRCSWHQPRNGRKSSDRVFYF